MKYLALENGQIIEKELGDFFELDVYGGLMPSADPIYDEWWELDANDDIMPREVA